MMGTTLDFLYDGRLVLRQPSHGYRFSVDAPLLTWFAGADRVAKHCVDLGAGCGVIGLGLLAAGFARKVSAVEIQPVLANLAMENVEANSFGDSMEILNADIRKIGDQLPGAFFDLVIANPPFWPAEAGRLPKDEMKQIACHETAVTLDDWVTLVRRLLHPRRGRVCVVFPAKRVDELLLAFVKCGITATQVIVVHPRIDEPAEIILLEARLGQAGRLTIAPPLFLKNEQGDDTKMAREILSGNFSQSLRALKDRR